MSDIKQTVTQLATNIQKTSSSFLKTTKLSIAITNEEETLKSIYLRIGKKVHEIYMYGGSLGKFFDEQYAEIMAAETKINELRARLNDAKGTQTCPKCGKIAERAAEFCPRCGGRMDCVAVPAIESDARESYKIPDSPIKTVVDSPVEADARFLENPPPPETNVAPERPEKITRFCRVCGTENGEETKFCISCGRTL